MVELSDIRCKKALEIISLTKDGSLLSPKELFLTQEYINDNLNEKGVAELEELYKTVTDGTFIPFNQRWFRDIENITADSKGAGGGLYIYWKGNNIEHYDTPWAYSDKALENLKELERRCKILESEGKEISVGSVIWNWEDED